MQQLQKTVKEITLFINYLLLQITHRQTKATEKSDVIFVYAELKRNMKYIQL